MVASFECCLSSLPQALFPLKFITLFCSKYKTEPDPGPLSTSQMELSVKIAIVAKTLIHLGQATFKKPPDGHYYTFRNLVELNNIRVNRTDFLTTRVTKMPY